MTAPSGARGTEDMTEEYDEAIQYPLRDASNEELVAELADQLQAVREAVNALNYGLLNEEPPVRESDVESIEDAGIALRTLSNTLTLRTDDEAREPPSAAPE